MNQCQKRKFNHIIDADRIEHYFVNFGPSERTSNRAIGHAYNNCKNYFDDKVSFTIISKLVYCLFFLSISCSFSGYLSTGWYPLCCFLLPINLLNCFSNDWKHSGISLPLLCFSCFFFFFLPFSFSLFFPSRPIFLFSQMLIFVDGAVHIDNELWRHRKH